jgi:flagellar hook-length control protein FliK
VPLDSAATPEIPVAPGVADPVAPAPAGAGPEVVREPALAGLAHDRAVLPDGTSHWPQPVMAPQAPAAAAPPATATTPPQSFTSASLGVPVGEPAWADAFGDQVLVLAGKQVQRAEIRLHPAELGPIQVQITVEDDATTLAFTAQHAVTREAIEQALPRLRELFGDQGLSLLNTTVSEQGARQHDREAGFAGRGPDAGVDDPGVPGSEEPAATPRRLGVRDTLIEMFA